MMKTAQQEPPQKVICISYVPLLWATEPMKNYSKDITTLSKKLIKAVEEAPTPTACLWANHNDRMTPCFVIERAKAVVDHLLAWTENQPGEWFRLCVEKAKDHYHVVLFPNLMKSKDRFSVQWVMIHEEIIPENAHHEFVFRPLHFRSKNLGMIEGVHLSDESMVGFVDVKDMSNDLTKIPDPTFIGPFKTNGNDELAKCAREYLKSADLRDGRAE